MNFTEFRVQIVIGTFPKILNPKKEKPINEVPAGLPMTVMGNWWDYNEKRVSCMQITVTIHFNIVKIAKLFIL